MVSGMREVSCTAFEEPALADRRLQRWWEYLDRLGRWRFSDNFQRCLEL
jgi:hypothetical protein